MSFLFKTKESSKLIKNKNKLNNNNEDDDDSDDVEYNSHQTGKKLITNNNKLIKNYNINKQNKKQKTGKGK